MARCHELAPVSAIRRILFASRDITVPAHLPIPLAYWPRTEQDLATVGERLGGRASLHVATTKVVRHVKGEATPRSGQAPGFSNVQLSGVRSWP